MSGLSTSLVTDTASSFDQDSGWTPADDITRSPLGGASAYQDVQLRHKHTTLPHLPSHRFRYSVWHDLNKPVVCGDQLKAPRVRDGPSIKEAFFYQLSDDNHKRVHHTKRGRERRNYRDKTENWEETNVVNLSYQDLGHPYQVENFIRVLKRLQHVEELNLMENGLGDLSSVQLPECTFLSLSKNYLKFFQKLPNTPKLQHLNLDDNDIEDSTGIGILKSCPLTSLSLRRNPLSFSVNYRQRIFTKLPHLKVLDGLPKNDDDERYDDEAPDQPSSCTVS